MIKKNTFTRRCHLRNIISNIQQKYIRVDTCKFESNMNGLCKLYVILKIVILKLLTLWYRCMFQTYYIKI